LGFSGTLVKTQGHLKLKSSTNMLQVCLFVATRRKEGRPFFICLSKNRGVFERIPTFPFTESLTEHLNLIKKKAKF